MPLTLIGGRANAGKTGAAHDAVRSSMAASRRTVLLLPSMPDVRRAQDELSAEFPVGLEIAQIDRYLADTWALVGDDRRLVGPTLRRILLRRAALEGGVPLPPGGCEGTLDLLGELAALAAQEGAPPPVTRGDSGDASSRIAGSLVAAVAAYQRLLDEEALIEPAGATRLVATAAPPGDTIVANRFVDLTPSQEAALNGWASGGADVYVSLTWDPEVPATRLTEPLVERLIAAGASLRLLPCREDGESPELARLTGELFSPDSRRVSQGDVTLLIAQGAEAECTLVARKVASWIGQGIQPERIAVVFRDVGRHHLWIRRALARERVSADFDLHVPFLSTGFGRVVHRAASQEAEALEPEEWQDLADRALSEVIGGPAPVTADVAMECAAYTMLLDATEEALGVRHHGPTLAELLEALAGRRVAAPSAERAGRVQVLGAEDARARRFDGVVIAGMIAGEFPGGRPGESFEGDGVREAMRRLGLSRADDAAERERMLFYLIVTGARRKLALSRQEADDEGSAVRGSVFIDELLDLYRDPVTGEGDAPGTERLTLAEVARARAVKAARRTARGGLGDDVRERMSGRQTFSPSEIETYLTCPYRWFVQRVLRPRVQAEGIDVLAAGSIAHHVLASVYDQLIEECDGPCRLGADGGGVPVERALELADSALAAECGTPDTHACLEERQLLSRTKSGVISLLERDASFLPGYAVAHVEWRFGGDGDEPEDLGDFSIRGQIDRIDLGRDGLVVVDYKSGRATGRKAFADKGLVQLQLYALVAERRLGAPAVAGLYRGLRSAEDRGFHVSGAGLGGLSRSDAVSPDELRALIEGAVSVATDAVRRMRAGDIAPDPRKGACGYCDWKALCGGAR